APRGRGRRRDQRPRLLRYCCRVFDRRQGLAYQWGWTRSARTQPRIEGAHRSKGIPTMLKSVSNSLILRGVLALIIGIISLAWPNVTILALVILFAVFAFMDAGLSAARAFSSDKAGSVVGYLLLSLIGLAAGVVALVWPQPTALVLTLIVGIWAFVGGLFSIFAGFQSGETAGTRAMFILTGLIWAAFGVVLF